MIIYIYTYIYIFGFQFGSLVLSKDVALRAAIPGALVGAVGAEGIDSWRCIPLSKWLFVVTI